MTDAASPAPGDRGAAVGASGLGRRFLALGAGETVARLCTFALTVYLARVLSPALYGIVGVAMGVMLYLTQLADGGLELVGVPTIARDRDRVVEIAAPILALRFVFAAALTAIVMVIGLAWIPQPDGAILAISALALMAAGLSTRWIHLGLEHSASIAAARTIGEVFAVIVAIALVRDAGDVARVPLAQFLGATTTSLILLVALKRLGFSIPWRWRPADALPLFRRARTLVVFTLLGLLLFNFDLIFLRIQSGPEVSGYYAAAYTFIAFAANIIVAFAHTVLPTLTRLESSIDERDRLFTAACAQASALAFPLAVGTWYVAEQVIGGVFGSAYLPGVVALQWLAWSIPLAALRELPVVALIAAGKERQLLRVNAVTAAANVALVVAIVPRYGLVGAAAATVATELIRLALATHYARSAGYPLVPLRRVAKPVAATALMGGSLVVLSPTQLGTSVPIGVASYAIGLILVRAIRITRRGAALSV